MVFRLWALIFIFASMQYWYGSIYFIASKLCMSSDREFCEIDSVESSALTSSTTS